MQVKNRDGLPGCKEEYEQQQQPLKGKTADNTIRGCTAVACEKGGESVSWLFSKCSKYSSNFISASGRTL